MSGIKTEKKQKWGAQDMVSGAVFPGFGTGSGTVCEGNDSRVTGAVPSTRTVTAGSGLSGGGDLSSNRTLAVQNLTGLHVKNATESLATPAATEAVQEVVVPFTTPSTTGSVGFITDRKYEVVGVDARKLTAQGGGGDELQVKVDGVSILSGGSAFSLSGKAPDAFLMINFDSTKLVIPSGSTVTFVNTTALLDSAVRGWLRLAPVA